MNFKKLALAGAVALAATPIGSAASAQEVAGSDANAAEAQATMAAMAKAFEAKPLDTQQQARLPVAKQIVEKAFPPGTYRKMMDETMAPMMENISQSVRNLPISQIALMGGLTPDEVDALGEGTLEEVMAIVDPAFGERMSAINTITVALITDVMDEIEPSYRAGLARAYAVRFSDRELADINAFFATPTGSNYAAQSMLIYTDPQVMSVMKEMMPIMMKRMPELMGSMRETMEGQPKPRSFSDLSDAEKAKVADLLGISVEQMEENWHGDEDGSDDFLDEPEI